AGVNYSHRSPKGNRQMKGLLDQAAKAAVKTKGSIFELTYRRLVPRLGHAQAIGAIAHRLRLLVWLALCSSSWFNQEYDSNPFRQFWRNDHETAAARSDIADFGRSVGHAGRFNCYLR